MKYCIMCKSAIDKEKERFKKIEDCEGKKVLKKVFMHHGCWEEFIIRKKDQAEMVKNTNELIKNVGDGILA